MRMVHVTAIAVSIIVSACFGQVTAARHATIVNVNHKTGAVTPYVNLAPVAEMMYGDQPCRVVWMADSFGVWYLPARLPSAFAVSDELLNITGITCGAYDSGNATVRTTPTVPYRYVHGSTEYLLHEDGTLHYSLPVKSLIEVRDTTPMGGLTQIASVRISLGGYWQYAATPWLTDNDLLSVRPLMVGSELGRQLGPIQFGDVAVEADASGFDTLNEPFNGPLAPQMMSSLAQDLWLGTEREFPIYAELTGTDNSALLAGYTVFKTDSEGSPLQTGVHWSVLADSSWSRFGFVDNMDPDDPAAPDSRKTFARHTMREWIHATSYREEPILFIVHLAEEADVYDGHYQFAEDFVREATAWCEGLAPNFRVLFIVNNAHEVLGGLDGYGEMANLRTRQQAVGDYCVTDMAHASMLSIFAMMDETYPTTDEKSGVVGAWDTFIAWTQEHGYDNFTYGQLGPYEIGDCLDNPNGLHPGSPEGAALFADQLKKGLHSFVTTCGDAP